MKSVCHRFHHNRLLPVRDHPVKLGHRILFIEWGIGNVDPGKQYPRFFYRGTLAQKPERQLKLCHVIDLRFNLMPLCHSGFLFSCGSFFLPQNRFSVHRISHKIQPGHTKPLFIDGIIIKRIIICHMGHTDHGIMLLHLSLKPKRKRIIPRCNGHLLPVRKFIIQIPSEVKVVCLINCCCTHLHVLLVPKITSILELL